MISTYTINCMEPVSHYQYDSHHANCMLMFCSWQKMVESELLVKSLFDDGAEGLTQRILVKAGVDTSRFTADLDTFM